MSVVLNLLGKLPILMNLKVKLPSNFPFKIFKYDDFSSIFTFIFATGNPVKYLIKFKYIVKNILRLPFFKSHITQKG